MGQRQISFFIDNKLFKEFTIECAKKEVKKTAVLKEAVKKFCEKKS